MEKLFEGIVRKVVIVFIALTAISWLLVVIGFAVGNEDDPDEEQYAQLVGVDRDEPESYGLWIVSISGPFLIIAAIIHAALWRPWSSIFGAIASLLSMFFVTGLGIILFYNGIFIREHKEDDDFPKPPEWFNLQFAGALMATVFWTIVIVLWNFYDITLQRDTRFQ